MVTSFSPVGEMQVTLVLSKTSSVNELQPPLGLPRWITHPNLPQGKEQVTLPMNFSPLSFSPVGEMLVSIVNEKPLTVK